MSKRLTQIVFLGALVLVATLLFFAGRNSPVGHIEISPEAKPLGQSNWDYNIGLTIEDLLEVDIIAGFMSGVYPKDESIDSLTWFRKAAEAWDSIGHGLMAGYYYEKVALKTNTAEDWYLAAKLFFNLQNRTNDTVARREISSHAMLGLEKTVELDPSNLDAKAELGVSYMESPGKPPMMGIGLLREVLQVSPDHNGALYYLAYLSMKSGQYDKAVERLERLTELNPDQAHYYRLLAQAHLELDDKAGAISAFESYVEHESDENSRAQALELIEQLKN